MNAEEASYLLQLIVDTYGDAAYRRQIGNGTWVVCICHMDDEAWFLWDFSDWRQYRRIEKAAARQLAIEKARAKSKRKGNKQLLAEVSA